MRTFSIHCKAKNLLATLALLLAACDPGPDDGDTGDETETTSETGSDTSTSGDGGDSMDGGGTDGGDGDSSGGDDGPGLDVGTACESLCPPETTLECGDGEHCVPTPTHPECQPC